MTTARSLLNERARRTVGGEIVFVRPSQGSQPLQESAHADIPGPEDLAAAQVSGARNILTRDISQAPRWAWTDLDAMTGPMLPGDLLIPAALTGNGKSTLLMSQVDAFAAAQVSTLYVPLEIEPEVNRIRWAAWKLNVDVRAVIRQEWSRLPHGTQEAIDCTIQDQQENPYIHFATPRRLTVSELEHWCRWATEHVGAQVVMLDHVHRIQFGGENAGFRVTVTEAMRRLKDIARELGIVLIASAQLNRASDPIDHYVAPQLGRLKESAGIAEEADVVLMLSRRLRRDLPDHWANDLRLGRITERDLGEPNHMVVTCRKHRLDDDAMNRSVVLIVKNGRLENKSRVWEPGPTE